MDVAAPNMDDSKTVPPYNEFNFVKQLASCREYTFHTKGPDGNMFNPIFYKNDPGAEISWDVQWDPRGPHSLTWINFNPIIDK